MSDSTIPEGYCQCGCGGRTPLATITNNRAGRIKGKPTRYIHGHNQRGKRSKRSIAADISAAYMVNAETDCWEWSRGLATKGYAQIMVDGKLHMAHRYIYELHRGPIPEGLTLDHLCRNRACVNPDHLEPVTSAENTRRGLSAKLSKREVAEVKWLRKLGFTYAAIANIYGVTKSNISHICSGRNWRIEGDY